MSINKSNCNTVPVYQGLIFSNGQLTIYPEGNTVDLSSLSNTGNTMTYLTDVSLNEDTNILSVSYRAEDGLLQTKNVFLPYGDSEAIEYTGLAPILVNNTTRVISSVQASDTTSGYLSSTDWTIFNNKLDAVAIEDSLTIDLEGDGTSGDPLTASLMVGGTNNALTNLLVWDGTAVKMRTVASLPPMRFGYPGEDVTTTGEDRTFSLEGDRVLLIQSIAGPYGDQNFQIDNSTVEIKSHSTTQSTTAFVNAGFVGGNQSFPVVNVISSGPGLSGGLQAFKGNGFLFGNNGTTISAVSAFGNAVEIYSQLVLDNSPQTLNFFAKQLPSTTTANVLYYNSANGKVTYGAVPGSTAYTVDNGLTASTATNFQLGGTGIQNTSINWGAFTFTNTFNSYTTNGFIISSTSAAVTTTGALLDVSTSGANVGSNVVTRALSGTNTRTGTTSTNVGVYGTASGGAVNYGVLGSTGSSDTAVRGVNSASGVGVYGQSGSSIGTLGSSTSGQGVTAWSVTSHALEAVATGSTTTNAPVKVAQFIAQANGSPTTGYGGYLSFQAETDAVATNRDAAQFGWRWSTITDASRTSEVFIKTISGALSNERFTLAGSGQLTLGAYGSGTFTGTAAKWLAVTSSGVVIEENAPSGGGGSARFGFSGEDDTATENRSFDQGAYTMVIHGNKFTHGTGDYTGFASAYSILEDGDVYFQTARDDGAGITTTILSTLASGGQVKLQSIGVGTASDITVSAPDGITFNNAEGKYNFLNLTEDNSTGNVLYVDTSTGAVTYGAAGGGGADRFGVSGEDDTGAEARAFNNPSNEIWLSTGAADYSNIEAELYIASGIASLFAQGATTVDNAQIGVNQTGQISLQATTGSNTAYFFLSPNSTPKPLASLSVNNGVSGTGINVYDDAMDITIPGNFDLSGYAIGIDCTNMVIGAAETLTLNCQLVLGQQYTPTSDVDSTYNNGTLTADDTYLYYRTSTGTWKKIAWGAF